MKTKRKNIFKSLLALTLALIMVLGVAPLSEFRGYALNLGESLYGKSGR